jgi:light-harvesting protein B-800-850 alpha chain
MNQGKIWLVVNPSVGLPLLLGSVAITVLLVHYAVLSNTTWVAAYFQGGAKKAAAIETMQAPVASLPGSVSVN